MPVSVCGRRCLHWTLVGPHALDVIHPVGKGLTNLFWPASTKCTKEMADGQASTEITLWGIDINTQKNTFTLPRAKVGRAIEFLAPPEFDVGNTRIPLRKLQELRGEMEHWAVCNIAIRPELAVVDRLLVTAHDAVSPKGNRKEMKQRFLEFWEAIEALLVNLSTPSRWSVSYTASFLGVLALEERLSPPEVAEKVVWVGSDATPHLMCRG